MGKILFLGTANAVASEDQENTHLAIETGERVVLVDCVGSPMARLRVAGVALEKISDLVLTHFHPDHVSSAPLLLMDLWLLGRREKLRVHGLHHTLDRFQRMMDLYDWQRWPDFFPVEFHHLKDEENMLVLDEADLRVFSSPVKHLLPTIGLRIEFPQTGRAAAYSCDTEPCDQMVRLASGAEVLIHESTGDSVGHSSAAQAGEVARLAGVARLYLIHYTPQGAKDHPGGLTGLAREKFPGPVELARDLMEINLA